jgi:hypothetical protein
MKMKVLSLIRGMFLFWSIGLLDIKNEENDKYNKVSAWSLDLGRLLIECGVGLLSYVVIAVVVTSQVIFHYSFMCRLYYCASMDFYSFMYGKTTKNSF